LTGQFPEFLRDDLGKQPHQREGRVLRVLFPDDPRVISLVRLFDRGFEYDSPNRFQTADELATALDIVESSHGGPLHSPKSFANQAIVDIKRANRHAQIDAYRQVWKKEVQTTVTKRFTHQSSEILPFILQIMEAPQRLRGAAQTDWLGGIRVLVMFSAPQVAVAIDYDCGASLDRVIISRRIGDVEVKQGGFGGFAMSSFSQPLAGATMDAGQLAIEDESWCEVIRYDAETPPSTEDVVNEVDAALVCAIDKIRQHCVDAN
jgi:hypothetical protein